MYILQHLLLSFLAAAAFGIIFNAPKSSLIQSGFVGMLGWMIYILFTMNGADAVNATLIASFVIAVASQVFAKLYRTPIIIFIVAGIIPLVPGGMAYDAMRNFVENDYNIALALAAKAFLISGAIAMGIVFSEVINQLIRKTAITKKSES
ncbi:threonine/serine exporter family protein [Robertmurraya korlensis]|uniref:threonine/serine exporter family protein n=1 Tax=Robertmurraya korlensis TaxID=519977 RepID=UPI00203B30A9|nr:threonine/serine exporter family protein [Robertmurraya korlensis]MCM3602918.1 threonine/serine exporter family protein [Robertmurraya korlensis]